MRQLYKSIIVLMAFVMLFPSFTNASWDDPTKPGWDDEEARKGWIQSKIQHMTLEEKVGQLFMVHVYGETPTDPNYEDTNLSRNRGAKNFKEMIEKYHIGGVIYFNWTANIGTPIDFEQVNALSNGLQEIAMDQRMPIPLMIATDQEGGVVARVTEPATVFPGNMALGATRSTDYARQSSEIMGMELMSLGINMDLAPVLDVNVNPENPVIGVRSYSENPDLVADMGAAQVEGYQNENVMATAKHFPGHGDTNVDSHYGLPIINHDLETLHEVDLKPFKAAIDAGIDAIMPAHIVVPALDDSGLPATLSKPILTDLLRGEMGFDGVIITDSLGMSGANVVPADRVPVEAFKAGADILLNPPNVPLAYDAMMDAVESGEISEKRVDESVFRILETKFKRGLFHDAGVSPEAIENIGLEENLELADQMTEESITLVKNEDVLPLDSESEVFVTGPSIGNPGLLGDLLGERGIIAGSYATGTSPTASQIANAVEQAADADTVIVTAYTANTNAAQQQLVSELKDAGKEVIVASMRNPYDIMAFPEVDANVLTYGFRDISVEALAKVLIGEVNPTGKLPVTIPELYEYGHGLSY
ncbi:beta-N-acetylhexosaminidase [Thalassobacillus devorans]|uniref:glycoside hydrolase family 3 protein n=1 Tax=Thalassobacillus devorans TaxID=279813 RepID=UPI001D2EE6B1|nr:glycoside hydrolase family 3 protein [Thalassobacillus devorans]NIK28779.1 beta-N-acetylhexosaminidase [Thalassobacillus devorans]